MTPKARKNLSSANKTDERTDPQAPSTLAGAGGLPLESPPRHEEIRRRAYEIYLRRGNEPGHELDDWLQAEREIEASLSPVMTASVRFLESSGDD